MHRFYCPSSKRRFLRFCSSKKSKVFATMVEDPAIKRSENSKRHVDNKRIGNITNIYAMCSKNIRQSSCMGNLLIFDILGKANITNYFQGSTQLFLRFVFLNWKGSIKRIKYPIRRGKMKEQKCHCYCIKSLKNLKPNFFAE